ncbi:hypothetical protein FALBO_1986 [Fusarium albosuccineum]|uniref:Uncharacterized protein n=1 Tax=Fusarium albosuccineum TaxID=1237068 RepID=A0A8H4LKX7_9HYPO|nr:hypothetical protein FALBO_1986 [Fusarium albosuccineum]
MDRPFSYGNIDTQSMCAYNHSVAETREVAAVLDSSTDEFHEAAVYREGGNRRRRPLADLKVENDRRNARRQVETAEAGSTRPAEPKAAADLEEYSC